MRASFQIAFAPEWIGRLWHRAEFTLSLPAKEVNQELLVQGEFLLCFSLSDFPQSTDLHLELIHSTPGLGCVLKSIVSLKMLLKQLSEPVGSIQHQSKYWHNSENVIHPFLEWDSGHCSESRTSGVPAGNFHFHWDHQILSCPSPPWSQLVMKMQR